MTNIKKLFGLKIKEYRIRLNYTQAQLAELVDVDNKHISCIENGKNFPSAELIDRLATALKTEPKYLFEFYHLQDMTDLKNSIMKMIDKLSYNDVSLIYKYIRTFFIN